MRNIVLLCSMIFLIHCTTGAQDKKKEPKKYNVSKTDKEWKQLLSSLEYYVLREAGTERAFTSPLNKNYQPGVYVCAACKTPLYLSEHKFDSEQAGLLLIEQLQILLNWMLTTKLAMRGLNSNVLLVVAIWDILFQMVPKKQRESAIVLTELH